MNVVVFSGTTEGRELSRQLAALGIEVTVSVATPLGQEEQGSTPGVTVRCGRLLPDEMAALLGDAALCIDATHPYAVEATKNIKAAAEKAGVGYLRLLRPASPLPENCLVFESAKQAAEALAAKEGNLLLATGAKELAQFAAIPPERLYPRVLPTLESIAACEAANIPHRNIIAMQGPFSFALNQAMMEQFHIRWLVTKDGGAAGGFGEKACCRGAAGGHPPPARAGRDGFRGVETLQGDDKMNVTLIGMGSGQPENLTLQGLAALRQADLILGARRLLAVLPAGCTENRAAAYRPDEVAELLQTSGAENAVLVYSGDTGFYSGASSMMEKLEALGVRARVLPGLSSIQLLAAALGRPWQGWNLVSAHGRTCDPVAECMQGRPTFFLTGGSEDPATLCAQLAAEGFGDVQAVVGQCLGTPEEKIFRGSVKELAAGRFNSLSVLLVEAAEVLPRRAPGLPDEAFERGDVPMTKQEVRAAVLAKLAVRPEDILWDVGAGTGSVSVELALAAPRGRVYAVECRPEGCALIKANREKFRTRNLVLVEGLAPAALSDLPAPDAVFIGGSKGSLAAIVDTALDKNPDARICVSAIALETLSAAVAALTAKGRTVQVSQIAVSRAKAVGGLHLMMAQNPIYLITGE